MKQIQFEMFGQPSAVAKLMEADDVGSPSAWEVVVDVEAFPINVADLATLAGRYGTLPKLPSTIGMEAVGRVRAIGASVKNLQVGNRVIILANNNWATRRKIPAAAVHPVPDEGDPIQYSMLKVNPATAYLLLTRLAELKQGDWILQTAPLSSVGQCILQIARARGIRTINVIHHPDSRPNVLSLGGDIVVEQGPDLAQRVRSLLPHQPLHYAFDAVAGGGVQALAESLSEGGQIINYGMLSGEACSIEPEQTIFRNITLRGFWLSKILNRLSLAERTELFGTLCQWMNTGALQLDVDSVLPLDSIRQALSRAEQRGRKGKVIVAVDPQLVPSNTRSAADRPVTKKEPV